MIDAVFPRYVIHKAMIASQVKWKAQNQTIHTYLKKVFHKPDNLNLGFQCCYLSKYQQHPHNFSHAFRLSILDFFSSVSVMVFRS